MEQTFLQGIWVEVKLHLKIFGWISLFVFLFCTLFFFLPADLQILFKKNAAAWFDRIRPYFDQLHSLIPKIVVGMIIFYLYLSLSFSLIIPIASKLPANKAGALLRFFLLMFCMGVSGVGTYLTLNLSAVVRFTEFITSFVNI